MTIVFLMFNRRPAFLMAVCTFPISCSKSYLLVAARVVSSAYLWLLISLSTIFMSMTIVINMKPRTTRLVLFIIIYVSSITLSFLNPAWPEDN